MDTSIRSSKFKAIVNEEIFSVSKELVDKINDLDTQYDYFLVENDVTYIKYKSGDFFKKHSDYLSVISNKIIEFTMIVCMNADCKGGRTIFHLNDFLKYKSEESKKKEKSEKQKSPSLQ